MHIKFGLRAKFLLITSILLVLIFSSITIVQISNRTRELRANLLDESKAFATLATQPIGNTFALYKDSGTIKIEQEVESFISLNHSITNITVVDVNGQVAFSHNNHDNFDVSASEARTFEPVYKNNKKGALNTIIYPYFEASGARRYSVVYTVSDDEIDKAVMKEAESLFYSGLISLLITLGLVFVFIDRFILKPIEELSRQASIISSGNLGQQITVRGRDEIASLGISVNTMADSLKKHISELQEIDKVKSEFMMITSHNLRTPLTIIDGYVENIQQLQSSPEQMSNALTKISSSVKRLEHFAEDILTISRFELGNNELIREKIAFGEFITTVVDDFSTTAELKKLKLEKDMQGLDAILNISVPYVRSAIWNILDNAAKFTDEGGVITIKTSSDDKQITIMIRDTGIGIQAEEIPKLFKKFHRGTSTFTYDYEGTGIGLYASKMVVERHGGKIDVTSSPGKGSTFTIHLPLDY